MSGDVRKAVTGASIGNAVEWFDFAIYGFLATFIAANFFPSGNETAALLNTFAIFAAAFFMRPLGGFVFGPLGDRIGRQRVLAHRDPADVGLDAGHRPAADLRHDRCRRPAAAVVPALPAGLLRRRRIRRRRGVSRRVRDRQATRPDGHVHGVVRGARVPDRLGDGDAAAGAAARGCDGQLRLAHPVPDRRAAGPRRSLHPAAPGRHPAVRGAEQGRTGRQVRHCGRRSAHRGGRSCR